VPRVDTVENIGDAIRAGMALAGAGDLVCVTGSIYMVAEAREVVLELNGKTAGAPGR
jgi:dihydrofolate synthase/folylpolyglutamate synthase